MKPLYVIKNEDAKLHVSKGNSKIGKGIWAFSTLPGNAENLLTLRNSSVLLTDIPGTCSKYCTGCFNGGCYAVNSAKLHHNAVIRAWAENTVLLRSGKLFAELSAFIERKNAKFYKTRDPKDISVRIFRINVSGEIESTAEFESWNNLAIAHPEVTFSVYTKNFDALGEFIDAHGDTADNFVVNVSQWNHVADAFLAKYAGRFNVFEYDDSNRRDSIMSDADKKRLAAMPHCPAVTKEGKHAKKADGSPITCDGCTDCYRKTRRAKAVYAH